jgi:endonuclease YncB( thermonuclease family)
MSRIPGFRRRGHGPLPPRSRLRLVGDALLSLVLLGLLALVAARFGDGPAIQIEGRASVVDGDSLVIAGERIRLRGIDAPELDQTCLRDGNEYACGRDAREALARLVGSRPVACASREKDRYGRLVADCLVAASELGRAQVAAGWAVAYGDFQREEAAARAGGRGLWSGTFDRPRDWRESHGAAAEAEHGRPWAIVAWLRAILGFP